MIRTSSRGRAALTPFALGLLTVTLLVITTRASGAPVNLAPLGTATASSEGFGASASDGNDGNRNGAFGAGSVFHTQDPDRAAFYQMDLGDSYYLDRIQVFPRTDVRQGSVKNFRLSVFSDDGAGSPGATVFTRDYVPTGAANYTFGTADPSCSVTSTLLGLISRWITPFVCACCTAAQTFSNSCSRYLGAS